MRLSLVSATLAPFLESLEKIPFVKAVDRRDGAGAGLELRVETSSGEVDFCVEVKRSYLDTSATSAVIAEATEAKRKGSAFLLLARYIPRPTAERLIEAGVNFVDVAGNGHLVLPPAHHWTSIGKKEPRTELGARGRSARTIQVLLTLVAYPDAAGWSVRKLARVSGVGKSTAANARRQLVEEGSFIESNGLLRPVDPEAANDELVFGYRHILRPKLLIGRYSSNFSPDALVKEMVSSRVSGLRFSLTGGSAAHRLQRFYRGVDTVSFLDGSVAAALKTLRLLPDRDGPITFLSAFGELVHWGVHDGASLAHPLLIYTELMSDPSPRAREAADELRKEFLGG